MQTLQHATYREIDLFEDYFEKRRRHTTLITKLNRMSINACSELMVELREGMLFGECITAACLGVNIDEISAA